MAVRLVLGWRSSSSSTSSHGFAFLRNLHNRATRRKRFNPLKDKRLKMYPFDPSARADVGEMAKAESSEHWELFKSWMSKHKKSYKGEKEMLYRFGIFTDCLEDIEKTNKKISSYRLGLNQFSDLNFEELPLMSQDALREIDFYFPDRIKPRMMQDDVEDDVEDDAEDDTEDDAEDDTEDDTEDDVEDDAEAERDTLG